MSGFAHLAGEPGGPPSPPPFTPADGVTSPTATHAVPGVHYRRDVHGALPS